MSPLFLELCKLLSRKNSFMIKNKLNGITAFWNLVIEFLYIAFSSPQSREVETGFSSHWFSSRWCHTTQNWDTLMSRYRNKCGVSRFLQGGVVHSDATQIWVVTTKWTYRISRAWCCPPGRCCWGCGRWSRCSWGCGRGDPAWGGTSSRTQCSCRDDSR